MDDQTPLGEHWWGQQQHRHRGRKTSRVKVWLQPPPLRNNQDLNSRNTLPFSFPQGSAQETLPWVTPHWEETLCNSALLHWTGGKFPTLSWSFPKPNWNTEGFKNQGQTALTGLKLNLCWAESPISFRREHSLTTSAFSWEKKNKTKTQTKQKLKSDPLASKSTAKWMLTS